MLGAVGDSRGREELSLAHRPPSPDLLLCAVASMQHSRWLPEPHQGVHRKSQDRWRSRELAWSHPLPRLVSAPPFTRDRDLDSCHLSETQDGNASPVQGPVEKQPRSSRSTEEAGARPGPARRGRAETPAGLHQSPSMGRQREVQPTGPRGTLGLCPSLQQKSHSAFSSESLPHLQSQAILPASPR